MQNESRIQDINTAELWNVAKHAWQVVHGESSNNGTGRGNILPQHVAAGRCRAHLAVVEDFLLLFPML